VTNVGLWVVVNGRRIEGYENDKQHVLYYLLHNMTYRHLKPFTQDAMKVSLAAQIMSSTVAAAIDTHVTASKEKRLKGSLREQPCHVIQFEIHSYFMQL